MLAVAHELFYWHGIRATGVDTVAAQAGVAPTTLYRTFPSKDALVAAYVDRAATLYRQWFAAAADRGGGDPRARVLAVFDALREQTRPEQCRGCPFLLVLAEMPDAGSAAHETAVAVKAWVRDEFAALAAGLKVAEPAALADQLALVMEGVYASVQALGVDGPAASAQALARHLLDAGDGPVRSS